MSMIRRHPEAFSLDRSDKTTKRIEDAGHLAFIRTLPSDHRCPRWEPRP